MSILISFFDLLLDCRILRSSAQVSHMASLLWFSEMSVNYSVIKLNVGGFHYETTMATLQAVPDSMLGKMFEGHHWHSQKDNNGEIFIDGMRSGIGWIFSSA